VTHFAVRAFKVKAVVVVGHSGQQKFRREDDEEEEEEEEEKGGGGAARGENRETGENETEEKDDNIFQNNGILRNTSGEVTDNRERSENDLYNDEDEAKYERSQTSGKARRNEKENAVEDFQEESQARKDNDSAGKRGNQEVAHADTQVGCNDDNYETRRAERNTSGGVNKAEVQRENRKLSTSKHHETSDDDVFERDKNNGEILDQQNRQHPSMSPNKTVKHKRKNVLEDDEDDLEEEDEDDGWQVWKSSVKVDVDDEGSGVKLCVRPVGSAHLVCVAEFEVRLVL
jgi:hypothetical protein